MSSPVDLARLMALINLKPDDLQAELEAAAHNARAGQDSAPPPLITTGLSEDEIKGRLDQYKAWFEADRKIPPQPAYCLSRARLVSRQLWNRQTSSEIELAGGGMKMTMLGFPIHSSTTPVQQLQQCEFPRPASLGKLPLINRSIFVRYDDQKDACRRCQLPPLCSRPDVIMCAIVGEILDLSLDRTLWCVHRPFWSSSF